MQVGSLVECVKGHPGILEEGAYYTISKVSDKGVRVHEATPPYPYSCFLKERFREVQSPDDMEDILFEVLADQLQGHE